MRIENHETSEYGGGSQVVVSLYFDLKELELTQTPFGTIVKLADFKSCGAPGAPALPCKQLKVAVPELFWPGSVEVSDEEWKCASEPATFVIPAQKPRAGGHSKQGDFHCAADCSCRVRQRPDRPPHTEAFDPPEVVPPDMDAYTELVKNPPPIVSVVSIEAIGATRIAIIQVDPLRMGQNGELELCTHVKFTIKLLKEPALDNRREALSEFKRLYGDKGFDPKRVIVQPERFLSGLDEATRLRDIAIANVINPKIIGSIIRGDWPKFEFPSDYLIITDDFSWDAASITPGVPRPGIIAAFERLAEAKRARGITARVVTITDIVAGTYGDVRTGSRDLQEVVRRFLKFVRNRWGVNWLLLGGDTEIVPIRQVAGGAQQGYVGPPLGVTPPAKNTSYWTGSHLNIFAENLGTWYGATTDNQLVHAESGMLIPYDSTGTATSTSPGWYFTTADDYATLSATATTFIRVEGPESILKSQLQFLYYYNTLPTDLYYASLESYVIRRRPQGPGPLTVPYVYEPEHDWDATGNGLYGQCKFNGEDIDGVVQNIDISVGRAPIGFAQEATDFVNKVLAYEGIGKRRFLGSDWPRKMLIVSDDWWDRMQFSSTGTSPPGDHQFFHDAAQTQTLVKIGQTPTLYVWELVARVTQNDVRLLPFKRTSNPSVRGWYYAISDTDTTPSQTTVQIPWNPVTRAIPTQWIVVHGPLEERTPTLYDLNPTRQESGMIEQEDLRKQVRAELRGINRVERLYEDIFDLPLADQAVAPLDFLTDATLTAALNTGPHIVSLSGHGNEYGCCGLYNGVAANLKNGLGFIAYADSCLTNDYNTGWNSMSEDLMRNFNGGAVAYVGNTRFSWVGYGDDFQRAFFHQLTATRNLGLLNDSRLLVVGTRPGGLTFERWQMFTLNLLGDPEMRVYRGAIPALVVSPIVINPLLPIIKITQRPPIGPPKPDPPPIKGVLVYVRQGKQVFSGVVDDEGGVHLPKGMFQKGELEVTVSHKDYAVTTETMFMGGK
ncbi:peptidase family C25-domain-containing protein [Paraphoma chrysanthemicola]|uniref:Peptidase family C25-domain-containing protein n=1 Tax=Paraphoma chrysanthemicola TaxID=798071 RepID=A0A8K0RBW3_9PLEO|nr:peptidase family C25-domain-containing protein [Paraphoma chrysanthemicola]